MKKLLIIFLGLALTVSSVNAQELPTKLGHINAQEILQAMPERAKAEKEITDLRTNLESTLQELSKEYEGKVGQFQQMDPSTPVTTQEALKNEIIGLETRIQSFQVNAEQELVQKQEALLQPMLKKVQDAIDVVGKENGFTYIFDVSTGSVLYKAGEDIGVMVKKKLGIM